MYVRRYCSSAVLTVAGLSAALPAMAYEPGYPGWSMPPGVLSTLNAATPDPGVYGFTEVYTAQGHRTGPGDPMEATPIRVSSAVAAILWAPGWTFLGARYEALIAQPFSMADAGAPVNAISGGAHNTFFVPLALSWKLGNTGLFVKTSLGITAPDGTITGPNGLANPGAPWWIIQPGLIVSYLKDGWNFTSNFSLEMNTPNSKTQYKTGDILHADFTATKTLGKWTFGPVASYLGQITDDRSSAFYHNAINVNRYNMFAMGALVGYNFGPVQVNFWAQKDLVANASGGGPGPDKATIFKGYRVYANMGFKF